MASWSDKGWRCSGCHNSELDYLRETRKAEVGMRKTAQIFYYETQKVDLWEESTKYKGWKWPLFWEMVNEVQREDLLIKQSGLSELKKQRDEGLRMLKDGTYPMEEEDYTPWEEEEPMEEFLPPLEKINWADYPMD